ncbi:hypothetical protein Tco_0139039 [Tanacetum coccineum]
MDTADSLLSNSASKVKSIDGKNGKGGMKPILFSSILKDTTFKKMVKYIKLNYDENVGGADVAIRLAVVDEVKLHNVPIVAYSKISQSLITTKLGRSIMLNAYMRTMCLKSWGRNTYARALIEVSSKKAIVDLLVVAIPFQNGSGHSMDAFDIKYEWQSPRCETCKIFDHKDEQCPKHAKDVNPTQATTQPNNKGKDVSLHNSFDELMEEGKIFEVNNITWKANNEVMDDSDSGEVKNIFVEDNGKPMDSLVDDARKKVSAPPKKTPMKTCIWSGRKADSPKRNVVFSPKTKVHYFDRDDIEEVEHENA